MPYTGYCQNCNPSLNPEEHCHLYKQRDKNVIPRICRGCGNNILPGADSCDCMREALTLQPNEKQNVRA